MATDFLFDGFNDSSPTFSCPVLTGQFARCDDCSCGDRGGVWSGVKHKHNLASVRPDDNSELLGFEESGEE